MPGRFVVAWFRGAPATTGRGWRGTGRGAWFVHVNRKVELLRWQVIHLGRLGERLEDPAAPRALILGAELGGYPAPVADLHSPVSCPLPDLRISRHVRDSISSVPSAGGRPRMARMSKEERAALEARLADDDAAEEDDEVSLTFADGSGFTGSYRRARAVAKARGYKLESDPEPKDDPKDDPKGTRFAGRRVS